MSEVTEMMRYEMQKSIIDRAVNRHYRRSVCKVLIVTAFLIGIVILVINIF